MICTKVIPVTRGDSRNRQKSSAESELAECLTQIVEDGYGVLGFTFVPYISETGIVHESDYVGKYVICYFCMSLEVQSPREIERCLYEFATSS